MGRPSGEIAKKKQLENTLRVELQWQIERGRCAYCRAPAEPDQPLTREHVIPRARGGRRNDVRIIVPACLRCNSHRGCSELVPFLLGRPTRISSFVDYLGTLSDDSLRLLDPRIFAELYAAVAILRESALHGDEWRRELTRLSSGRPLHRRRHAARRAMWSVSHRIAQPGPAGESGGAKKPSSRSPVGPAPVREDIAAATNEALDEPLELLASRLVGVLGLLWGVAPIRAENEMGRALAGSALDRAADGGSPQWAGLAAEDILPLDGWSARPRRRRLRVDRRQGRASRRARGRAA